MGNGNNIGVIVQQGYNNSVTAIQEGNSVGVALNAIQIGFNSNLMISQSGSGLRDVNPPTKLLGHFTTGHYRYQLSRTWLLSSPPKQVDRNKGKHHETATNRSCCRC